MRRAFGTCVIDVPAVVARGREFAIQRGAPAALEFSDAIDDIDGVDVVFASGSLQYLPETLTDVLRRNDRRPRRIVINTTPFHEQAEFTLSLLQKRTCHFVSFAKVKTDVPVRIVEKVDQPSDNVSVRGVPAGSVLLQRKCQRGECQTHFTPSKVRCTQGRAGRAQHAMRSFAPALWMFFQE